MVQLEKQIFCFRLYFWIFLKSAAFYLPEKRFKEVKITSEEGVDRGQLIPLNPHLVQRNLVSPEVPLSLPKIEGVEEELEEPAKLIQAPKSIPVLGCRMT